MRKRKVYRWDSEVGKRHDAIHYYDSPHTINHNDKCIYGDLHRFSVGGGEKSSICIGDEQIWWCERAGEKQMIKEWIKEKVWEAYWEEIE